MATSSHFGLKEITAVDSFADDDYAFSTTNIDTIDTELYRHATHHHTGATTTVATPSALTLQISSTPGTLSAGTRYYYRQTWIDPTGIEGLASPEAYIDTPSQVVEPAAPILTSSPTGGTLPSGNYFYVLSAYKPDTTHETLASNAATINIPLGSTNKITVTFPALPTGACGFNIYRKTPNGIGYFFVDSVNMSTATPPSSWVDDGTECTCCDRTLPIVNTTTYETSVVVRIGGATPAIPAGYKWRIYRTAVRDNYTSSVVTTIETSALLYVDTGTPTTAGSLPTQASVTAPDKVTLTNGAEVQGTVAPANLVFPHVVQFTHAGLLAATANGTFAWRCPYDKALIRYVVSSLGKNSTAAATAVIVDINKYNASAATPAWASIFSENQSTMPQIAVGNRVSAEKVPAVTSLVKGDLLTMDIDQIGGGATPNDRDLLVQVVLWYSDTTATSIVFP